MKKSTFFLKSLFLFFLIGCLNDDSIDIASYDSVKVTYTEEYWNNNNPKTYYLDNTIRWLENQDGFGNSNPSITRVYDDTILSSIQQNMNDLGYTQLAVIDSSTPPDLIISAQALATTFTDIDIIWDDWYNWWDFYDPWYPGGYYPIIYQWTEGTVLIEMGDYASLDSQNKKIDIVWATGINGLVRENQIGNVNFIQNKVDEAFDQSPYLKN
ncbi:hypothetical protein UJ101_00073 [Flavobacteriaceae bacterium UJ101]|nr:hypothetical protein UJ101_00073 [Flavobacteriaceae bacterium UJ101]